VSGISFRCRKHQHLGHCRPVTAGQHDGSNCQDLWMGAAADRAILRRARRSVTAVRLRRPPGCPRLWAGAHPQASPAAVRGHATPVPGFYLGGGGVHPGVPGLLGAGMLAAQVAGVSYGLAGPPAARP
jgi:hypothetical protein